jgi:hypothetical protein
MRKKVCYCAFVWVWVECRMSKNTPPHAAALIRAKIAQDGRKMSWLAAMIGAPPPMLSAYLAGKHVPGYERRKEIACALEIPELASEAAWR